MSELKKLFLNSVVESLELSVFVMVTPSNKPEDIKDLIGVKIEFLKPKKGILFMGAERNFLDEVSQDMDTVGVQHAEIIGEILNMASGIFFEKWLGDEEDYELKTPLPLEQNELKTFVDKSEWLVTEQGHKICIGLVMEDNNAH